MECVAVEEQDGAEGLILRRGGDILLGCEMSQELPDLLYSHLARVALVVK